MIHKEKGAKFAKWTTTCETYQRSDTLAKKAMSKPLFAGQFNMLSFPRRDIYRNRYDRQQLADGSADPGPALTTSLLLHRILHKDINKFEFKFQTSKNVNGFSNSSRILI